MWRRLAALGFNDQLHPPEEGAMLYTAPKASLASPLALRDDTSLKGSVQRRLFRSTTPSGTSGTKTQKLAQHNPVRYTASDIPAETRKRLAPELEKPIAPHVPMVGREVPAPDISEVDLCRRLRSTENDEQRERIERVLQLERELRGAPPKSPMKVKETSKHLLHASAEAQLAKQDAMEKCVLETKHDGQKPVWGARKRLYDPTRPGRGGVVQRPEPKPPKPWPIPNLSPGMERFYDAFAEKFYRARSKKPPQKKHQKDLQKEPLKLSQSGIDEIVKKQADDCVQRKRRWLQVNQKKALDALDNRNPPKLEQHQTEEVTARLYNKALEKEAEKWDTLERKYVPSERKYGGGKLSKEDIQAQAARMHSPNA